ncbi:TonB family protein [Thalassotalea aquiviva]|uniref:energy transducer TonB n=1 Tax=Thalassotalea aquiviva TaxID=3242415 RepID=UPI00352B89EE
MKYFISIILGACISFLLFAIMATLIATDEVYIEPPPDYPIIDIVKIKKNEKMREKQRILNPPPPPPPKRPDASANIRFVNKPAKKVKAHIAVPEIKFSKSLEAQSFAINIIPNSDATPIYRALPKFPPNAAENNITGWVKLKFSISRLGTVEDVEVLESSPELIFDQAAIDALNRWKYKAKIVDGKTVKQESLVVRIDFNKKSHRTLY